MHRYTKWEQRGICEAGGTSVVTRSGQGSAKSSRGDVTTCTLLVGRSGFSDRGQYVCRLAPGTVYVNNQQRRRIMTAGTHCR
jgi:hypothetical protein